MASSPLTISKKDFLPLQAFVIPPVYVGDLDSVMIPYGYLVDRLERMAADINSDYDNENIHFLCVLSGGRRVFNVLEKHLKHMHRYDSSRNPTVTHDFIQAKSYLNDSSTGEIKIGYVPSLPLEGKHIIIVEDIVDSGKTIKALVEKMSKENPKSLKVASLLVKDTPLSNGFQPDYAGFIIPDEFVVGFCLDYNEIFRDLDHLCVISQQGKEKYARK